MEHRLAAGVRKADALLSALGKRRELGHRRQHLGEGATGLLDLPLGVKIPVLPGSKPVFSRAKLGEKLHRPSCSFDLGDPYCRLMRTEYNSLHDPHLQAYHNRQDNIRRLKRAGYVTSDGQVVCTLKEFNEYRQYLTTLKVEAEKMFRREEERLRQQLPKLKDAPKLRAAIDTSCPAERLLQPRKPSCPPPAKSRTTSLKSRRCRRLKAALDEGQAYCQPELGQEGAKLPRRVSSDADSKGKPGVAAGSVSKAALEPQPAPRAQKLEEVAETVVQEVSEGAQALGDESVSVLRRAAVGIRGRLCGSAKRAEPSEPSPPERRQETGLATKELGATVSESLGKRLPSSMSEAGPTARWKEQPVAGGASRAGKCEEEKWRQAETAASERDSSQASLDKVTREAVASVCCPSESFAASELERDFSCTSCEILELLMGNVSKGQPQPSQTPFSRQGVEEGQGFPRASELQNLEASKGAKLPALQPLANTIAAAVLQLSHTIVSESFQNAISRVQQRQAEQTGHGRTIVPEVLGTVKEKVEGEKAKAKATALANTLARRTTARRTVASGLERICQPGPAPPPELNFGRRVAKPPARRDGEESYPAEDTLPSMGPHFARQPVPPAGPKPPAQTGARRRSARVKRV
ncbi:uncharacterized protein FYN12_009238 isoform 1-T3 [Phoenicopterus ruber ruber]